MRKLLRGLTTAALAAAAALSLSACASLGMTEDQAVLDFSIPPAHLYPARLVEVDGEVVTQTAARTSYWLDPGTHAIEVTALIDEPTKVGVMDRPGLGDQGEMTIDVEAGKRYKMAAELTGQRGEWRPVIYRIEDI